MEEWAELLTKAVEDYRSPRRCAAVVPIFGFRPWDCRGLFSNALASEASHWVYPARDARTFAHDFDRLEP